MESVRSGSEGRAPAAATSGSISVVDLTDKDLKILDLVDDNKLLLKAAATTLATAAEHIHAFATMPAVDSELSESGRDSDSDSIAAAE